MWIKKVDRLALESRIKSLENKLCPFNSHDYVIIDSYMDSECLGGVINCWTVRKLECLRCGKKVIDNDQISFKYKARENGGLI
jgi:hypothetical protein